MRHYTWDKVFKNGPSKICGRQPLKNLKRYGQRQSFTNFTWSIFECFVPNVVSISLSEPVKISGSAEVANVDREKAMEQLSQITSIKLMRK